MVDVAAGPRGKQDVSVDLAASVLAICGRVRTDLARQRPHVGHEGEQAGSAFAAHAGDWSAMVMPAARDAVALAPALGSDEQLREQLARDYADNLAQTVSAAAAEGLAEAMDIQTARDVHPDVAWQRAVTGYGLPKKPMRSFITAALRTPEKAGIAKAAAPQGTIQANAERALIAYADKIGECEVAAWSTLDVPEPIGKAFDPSQRRDEDGKWTQTAGGGSRYRPAAEARTAERAADGVDELLSGGVAEPAERSRYGGEQRYGSRYGAQQRYGKPRYGAAESRYGGESRYAAKPSTENRYKLRYNQQTTAQRAQRHIINSLYVIAPTKPNQTPREPASTYGLFLPLSAVGGYFTTGMFGYDQTPSSGGEIDFSHISAHVHSMPTSFGDTVELQEMDTPWEVDEGLRDVPRRVWDNLLQQARPLWEQVKNDPLTYANQLDPNQLGEVFRRAGYDGAVSREDMQVELERNEFLRSMEVSRFQNPVTGEITYYDDGLSEALADFVVWHEAGVLGEDGYEFQLELDTQIGSDRVDDTPLPGVMVFSEGLADGDTPKNLSGRYRVKSVEYHSVMSEYGDAGAPVGKIAMRELHVVPQRV